MSIRIIADSSQDIDDEIRQKHGLTVDIVPFKLYLEEVEHIDDEKLDVIDFIGKMVSSKVVPKTACPSPNDFYSRLNEKLDNYIVTISSRLSGTYNSAQLAVKMWKEEFPNSFVHVFDSKSAACAETLISLKVAELDRLGRAREEIVTEVEEFISGMTTVFILESLDNLMKNGRISKLKGTIASVFNIKPIMYADEEGEIQLLEKSRGSDKAFARMAEIIKEKVKEPEKRILAISHVDNLERAEWLRDRIISTCPFKEVLIVQTMGLSSLYADNKGIIVSF